MQKYKTYVQTYTICQLTLSKKAEKPLWRDLNSVDWLAEPEPTAINQMSFLEWIVFVKANLRKKKKLS